MNRIAILDRDRCRPKDCGLVCIKYCPLVRSNIYAIKIEEKENKPTIYEKICSGCGICVKKCPFNAISIVNLPQELETECSHRFGKNMFKIYRLPLPQPGIVTGLIGKNGIGKSTILKILAGDIKPNLGKYDAPPKWPSIIRKYRGSVLQEYFVKLRERKLKVVHKPQYVDLIPKVATGRIDRLLEKADERGKYSEIMKKLQLENIRKRDVGDLSGGELQRLAVAIAFCKDADVYLFDEPSSYLDVKQRLETAKVIRSLKDENKIIIVAEHDLIVLDYLSDQVYILYGKPSVYGVVSNTQGTRVGINTYLNGYISSENVRFRETAIKFHAKPPITKWNVNDLILQWEPIEKSYEDFSLTIESGNIHKGEIIGVLGPNGIGKTTFIKLLVGLEKPDKGYRPSLDNTTVSYKPQYISVNYNGSVETILRSIVKGEFDASQYQTTILQPLNLEHLLERKLNELSGGELQRLAIATCLSKKSSIYLLDEPSAYLDVEERLTMARTIRRLVENKGVVAFVVEHDVAALDFIADRIMVFDGDPGLRGHAYSPTSLRDGMNMFLRIMGVTFRRDSKTKRPRVNKEASRLDRYQKEIGQYYYVADTDEEKE
ncbi:MAG: ribosome biogenesis/translation initiation ATPase RLI [Candidatus Bathyarchaeota archaeon]|nr:MAG: ribosome biogenesis/translation initiation ATPase RLI [Candidatus Bathyarchaeota archaeon]